MVTAKIDKSVLRRQYECRAVNCCLSTIRLINIAIHVTVHINLGNIDDAFCLLGVLKVTSEEIYIIFLVLTYLLVLVLRSTSNKC